MSLWHWGASAEHGHGHGTVIETLDPRVKLACALVGALWIGLVPAGQEGFLVLLGLGLLGVAWLARISPATMVFRAGGALPFVLVPGLLRLLAGSLDLSSVAWMATRGYLAAMVATLLVSITPFPALLAAASALGVPDLLVQTTALIYRYLQVLRERAAALAASARARGYGPRSPRRVAVGGSMLGALLLRSLDRAERVHAAMLARGYTGRLPSTRVLAMGPLDWVVGALVPLGALGSLLWLR